MHVVARDPRLFGFTRARWTLEMLSLYGQGRYDCPEHGSVDPLPRTRADLDAGVFEHRCPVCQARRRPQSPIAHRQSA